MMNSNREHMVGGYTTVDVKKALQVEARKRKISVSLLVHQLLTEAAKKLGHPVPYEYTVRNGGR